MSSLWLVALAIVVVNLPFGFWRAGTRRFSVPWVVAVHAPVPLVIGLRVIAGLGWQLSVVPVLVGAYAVGQFLGGRLRSRKRDKARPAVNRTGENR